MPLVARGSTAPRRRRRAEQGSHLRLELVSMYIGLGVIGRTAKNSVSRPELLLESFAMPKALHSPALLAFALLELGRDLINLYLASVE